MPWTATSLSFWVLGSQTVLCSIRKGRHYVSQFTERCFAGQTFFSTQAHASVSKSVKKPTEPVNLGSCESPCLGSVIAQDYAHITDAFGKRTFRLCSQRARGTVHHPRTRALVQAVAIVLFWYSQGICMPEQIFPWLYIEFTPKKICMHRGH